MTKEQLEKISEKLCGVEIDKYEFQDFIVGEFETEKNVFVEKGASSTPNNEYVIAYEEGAERYIHIEIKTNHENEEISILNAWVYNFRS
ncbi:MAG: hypothetical protein SOY60_05205 [Fusobacterium gastrosuis]|uniref:hypothetical protein n=1 Tax=Fusobacterium gastrosuis TaxID=1755100 RepID=UPI0029727D4F|nr:hypothetical protein [Fusobacteriaceae bacterium]MDY4011044.1 hypothetical protein [Fusobacterium gastrosuis]MDY5714124.1 hypothetical protein [Fusobacterium gastrosuis]